MDSLIEAFENTDFGLFVFAATDVTKLRGEEVRTVRDNVVFELGLCIGRLGKERSFLLIPRGKEADFHLPTDLLGITPAVYDADRQDGNMSAALGPACSKISRIVGKLGTIRQAITALPSVADELPAPKYTEGDITAIIASWMGNRPSRKNLEVIHFARVDEELRLPSGSAKRLLEGVARNWRYRVKYKGEETVLFEKMPQTTIRFG